MTRSGPDELLRIAAGPLAQLRRVVPHPREPVEDSVGFHGRREVRRTHVAPPLPKPREPLRAERRRTADEDALQKRSPVALEIVIPARNEEERLPLTLERSIAYLQRQRYSAALVVVDNGSSDRTVDVVRRADNAVVPVHLVGCSKPGKGSAVCRGILTGTSRWTGYMDADLATPIEMLEHVMPLLEHGSTVVIATRHAPSARIAHAQPLARRIGGNTFRALARTLLPESTDTQCGFKFFDGQLARAAAARCRISGFSFDVELLARLDRGGHRAVEFPVDWRDVPGSTFSAVRDGFRSYADVLRVHGLLLQA